VQVKTQEFKSKFIFETKSIYAEKSYKILRSTWASDLDKEVDSINPIYFYVGDTDYLVEIEDTPNLCIIKHLISVPMSVREEISKSMLANEEALFNMLDEMALVGEVFLFDAKNLAVVTFDDFEMNIEKQVGRGDIFCTEKGAGIIKLTDLIHVFSAATRSEAFDLSIFSLYNRSPYIQNPKSSLVFDGCLLSTIVSGLFSGVQIEEIQDEANSELDKVQLEQYIQSKLGGIKINTVYINRMIGVLKIDNLKEILNKKEDNIIDAEIVMKEGETAFLSRIMEMGLNIFMSKLPANNGKPVQVEIDIPNIGAKKIFLRAGAAFIVPENNDTYKDLAYWMSLLNSDNVAFAMS
jgi:hypothetical protein